MRTASPTARMTPSFNSPPATPTVTGPRSSCASAPRLGARPVRGGGALSCGPGRVELASLQRQELAVMIGLAILVSWVQFELSFCRYHCLIFADWFSSATAATAEELRSQRARAMAPCM